MSTLTKAHTCACGSEEFILSEYIVWKATTLGDDGHLNAYKVTGNGIELIKCRDCGAEYDSSAFADIDFS